MEQRRHKRYDIEGVRGALVYDLDAEVLNMSLTGLAVETTSMLRVGSEYRLRIESGDGDDLDEDLQLELDVKWCQLVRTEQDGEEVRPIYQAGFDFREVLDEKAREILRFMEDHVIIEMEDRVFGRFVVDGDSRDGFHIDTSRQFVVERISLSGMLITTDFIPEVDRGVELEIELPGDDVDVRGRIAYVEPDAARKSAEVAVGVEFAEMDEPTRAALESFIERQIE